MIDFFETYKNELLYALLIVCGVLLLQFVTHRIYLFLIKRDQEKFHGTRLNSYRLLKRIFNVIWIILGIMGISSLFLTDVYMGLRDNFRLIIYIGIVSALSIILASSVNLWFRMKVEQKMTLEEDPTVFKFLRYVAVFGVYATGLMFVLLAFPSLKGVAQTALGGAGLLALIAGISSQEALANLVGGLFIISFKPFKIGDVIKLSDSMVGTVVDITLRHTILRNVENKMIVIPNAIINKEKLINYNLNDLKICDRLEIGISYDSDIDLAKKIMKEEAEAHPLIFDNRSATDKLNGKPVVRVSVVSLDDSSVRLRAYVWAKNNSDSWDLRYDLLEGIKKRFDREGVEIPFPYRTVVIKEDKNTTENLREK